MKYLNLGAAARRGGFVGHGAAAVISPLLFADDGAIAVNITELHLLPDFVDGCIHLREPEFFI